MLATLLLDRHVLYETVSQHPLQLLPLGLWLYYVLQQSCDITLQPWDVAQQLWDSYKTPWDVTEALRLSHSLVEPKSNRTITSWFNSNFFEDQSSACMNLVVCQICLPMYKEKTTLPRWRKRSKSCLIFIPIPYIHVISITVFFVCMVNVDDSSGEEEQLPSGEVSLGDL